jgi:hypothetical protein
MAPQTGVFTQQASQWVVPQGTEGGPHYTRLRNG